MIPFSVLQGSTVPDNKKRRPSTIAEQPLKGITNPDSLQSLRLRTTSESESETQRSQQQQQQQAGSASGMTKTEYKCITCGSPILDNTSSTTACVKCARLRTRRMNFAHPPVQPTAGCQLGPSDSRDSGVSSQDCGEITPTAERQMAFMRHPLHVSTQQPCEQMNKLVRKLSEVEGIDHSSILRNKKASMDEGVELDYSDSALSDSSSVQPHPSQAEYGGPPTSNSSSNCGSLDSGSVDPGWTQSLPSCSEPNGSVTDIPSPSQLTRGACRYNPMAAVIPSPSSAYDRGKSISPVNFREGRRSSDGLVAQGIIAFQQKLYVKEKATGLGQLHEAQQEVLELQSQYPPDARPGSHGEEPSSQALLSRHHRASISKRISLPDSFVYFPQNKHLALQQQLLQHRILQKRQSLQKQRFTPDPLTGLRRVGVPYGKPYLPTDGLPLSQQGTDFLFQPIAEDEPSLGMLKHLFKNLENIKSISISHVP